jgi:hypothetical protein
MGIPPLSHCGKCAAATRVVTAESKIKTPNGQEGLVWIGGIWEVKHRLASTISIA